MKKRTALVCEHLEHVSREALERYQGIVRNYVRRRQGVYALYRRRRLYYVGLAGNLRSRLASHMRDRHGDSWDEFSVYLTIGDAHLHELESLILRIVRPAGNVQKGRFAKSEDLRRRFDLDLQTHQRRERNRMLGRAAGPKVNVPTETRARRGRTPALAKYTPTPKVLRARFKGKLLKARVRRDGSIRYGGKVYLSPSLAAAAACQRRTCNGWTFWLYQRAPGDWVRLDTLRR